MSSRTYPIVIKFDSVLFDNLLEYLQPKREEKILDIGCHRGFYVKAMEKYTKEILGIDIDHLSLRKAVSKKVRYGNATNLKFSDNTFDKIYSLHTIEHILNPRQFLLEVARVLKPGGRVLIVYPFELFRGAQAIISACLMYKNPFMARKMHLHKLTPKKIKKFIKNTSLRHQKSQLVFTINRLSWQYFTLLNKIK